MPSAFRYVGVPQWSLINVNNIKPLAAARQISAIHKWWELHLKRDQRFALKTDEEMQEFIADAAAKMGIDTDSMLLQTELKKLKGAGSDWKTKILNKNGIAVDLDTNASTRSQQVQRALEKILDDKGRNDHGNTLLGGNNGSYLHWRVGSERIFGTYNPNGTFTLIGVGRHTGGGHSSYSVNLITGGTTTAQTA